MGTTTSTTERGRCPRGSAHGQPTRHVLVGVEGSAQQAAPGGGLLRRPSAEGMSCSTAGPQHRLDPLSPWRVSPHAVAAATTKSLPPATTVTSTATPTRSTCSSSPRSIRQAPTARPVTKIDTPRSRRMQPRDRAAIPPPASQANSTPSPVVHLLDQPGDVVGDVLQHVGALPPAAGPGPCRLGRPAS
jgi:hypothetical protein